MSKKAACGALVAKQYKAIWEVQVVMCRSHVVTQLLAIGLILLAVPIACGAQDALPLTNPGFEMGEELPGWNIFSGTSGNFQLSTQAHSGSFSLQLTDPSSEQAVGLRSDKVPVQPGETYIATAWVRTDSGTAQLYLEFWDEAGTRVDVVFAGASGNTWRTIRLEREAPSNAVAATVLLYGHRTNQGTLYFDDIELISKDTSGGGSVASFSPSEVLVPQIPEWTDRPSARERIAQGFEVKVTSHPRLYVTKEDLSAILERMAGGQNPFGVDLQQMRSQLETAALQHRLQSQFVLSYYGDHTVTYPLPPQQPDPMPNPPSYVAGRYPYWTAMGSHLRTRLLNLAGAYLFSGDPAYAETAKRDMLALAEWDVWSDPSYECGGQTCLDTGYIVEGVAFAYDVLYDILSESERTTIRTALIEKGLKPLYADTARKLDHNIHMVRTAALGIGALLLLGEEPDMERYLAQAYENFFWYLDQRIDTGATEGMLYTSVSMEHIAKFADALERVTGDRSMFDHPYVKEVLPYWVIYGYGPRASGLVNFSDSQIASYFFTTMLAIGRVNDLPQANWYVATAGSGGALDRLLHLDPNARVEAPPADWPTSKVFPDIGWAYLRSGWGPSDSLFAFVSSGSRMGHNHFDQNHFVLNVGGEWLIKDNGYQDYNPGPKNDMTNGTLGHNAALINGRGQTAKGGGKLAATFLSETVDYVAGDASAAYAGSDLQGWIRHVLFVKPSQIVMLDEYLLRDDKAQPAWLIHPNGQVIVDNAALTVGFEGALEGFDIRRGTVGTTAHMLWPIQQKAQYLTTPGAEEYGPYLKFETAVAGRRVVVATLFDLYSADKLRLFSGEYNVATLDVVDDSGRSVLRTQEGLLFRAQQVGDRMSVEFSVPAPGTYRLALAFATSSTYGAVQVELDGTAVGPTIDTYSQRFGETGMLDLGEVTLGVGTHTLTLQVVEGDEASRGHFVLLQRLMLTPPGENGEATPASGLANWKELPSRRRVSPTDLNEHRLRFETADESARDLYWFSLNAAGSGTGETEGIVTDGANAWARVSHAGQVQAYAMAGGSTLKIDGVTQVESPFDVNISLGEAGPGRWVLEIDAVESGSMTVRIPASCFTVSGSGAEAVTHTQSDVLRISVTPGRTRLEVTACTP